MRVSNPCHTAPLSTRSKGLALISLLALGPGLAGALGCDTPRRSNNAPDTQPQADVSPDPGDAVGTTDIAPPPVPCGGCPEGQICLDDTCTAGSIPCPCPSESYCDLLTDTCVAGCIEDTQCSAGRICLAESRTCRAGCRQDAQCPSSGTICDAQTLTCRAGCRSTNDCGAEQLCDPATLTCLAGCRQDNDCGSGRICDASSLVCRSGCRQDNDCGSGQICDDASLVCRSGCRQDNDCGAERICNAGTLVCEAGCRNNSGCIGGDICRGGQCAPDGFVRIASGSFTRGSPSSEFGRNGGLNISDQEVQHQVTLTRPFWIQEAEVTQAQWKALSGGVNPACYQNPGWNFCGGVNGNDSGPVERVDFYSVLAYANALSVSHGREPCYTLTGCTDPTNGWKDGAHEGCTGASFDYTSCSGYRLPTEAEWEYAARAGTTAATYAGNLSSFGGDSPCRSDQPVLDGIAWWCGSGGGFEAFPPQPVKGKTPNAWGLYDMLGNVAEWTWDEFDCYGTAARTDPVGPAPGMICHASDGSRVQRGGSTDTLMWVRAASRSQFIPNLSFNTIGFRLTRTILP